MSLATVICFFTVVPAMAQQATTPSTATNSAESNLCRQLVDGVATYLTLDEQKGHTDNGVVRRQIEDKMEQTRKDIDTTVFASRNVVGWQATVTGVDDFGYDDLYVKIGLPCSPQLNRRVDFVLAVARTPATLASIAKLHNGDIVTFTGTFVNPENEKPANGSEEISVGSLDMQTFALTILATDVRSQ